MKASHATRPASRPRPATVIAAIIIHGLPLAAWLVVTIPIRQLSLLVLFAAFSIATAITLWTLRPAARRFAVRLPLLALAAAAVELTLFFYRSAHPENMFAGLAEMFFTLALAGYALLMTPAALLLNSRSAKAAFGASAAAPAAPARRPWWPIILPIVCLLLPVATEALKAPPEGRGALFVYAGIVAVVSVLLLLRLPVARALAIAVPVLLWLVPVISYAISPAEFPHFWTSSVGTFLLIFAAPATPAAILLLLPYARDAFRGR